MYQPKFTFYTDEDGQIQGASIDIVDLKYICHQVLKNNKGIIEELLETLNEIDNEND